MTQVHIIEVIIFGIILIAMYITGNNIDERLTFLEKSIVKKPEAICSVPDCKICHKEPLFKSKIKAEEKRIKYMGIDFAKEGITKKVIKSK